MRNINNMGRLETHFGLPASIENLLIDTGISKCNISSLRCISIQDVIDNYVN